MCELCIDCNCGLIFRIIRPYRTFSQRRDLTGSDTETIETPSWTARLCTRLYATFFFTYPTARYSTDPAGGVDLTCSRAGGMAALAERLVFMSHP